MIAIDGDLTFIDAGRGLSEAVFSVLKPLGKLVPKGLTEAIHSAEWALIQELDEFVPYRTLLTAAIAEGAASMGIALDQTRCAAIAATVSGWPPFEEALPALQRIVRRFPLAVITNLDAEDMALRLRALRLQIDHTICAERVLCFKPEPDHWLALMHERELEPEELLVVSASPAYDLASAEDLGIPAAYIDRHGEPLPAEIAALWTISDLNRLADQLVGPS